MVVVVPVAPMMRFEEEVGKEVKVAAAEFKEAVAGSENADAATDSNADDDGGEEIDAGLLPFCLALRANMRVAAAAHARTTSTAHRATPAVRPARRRPL
jgi:hypothetical protein